MKMTYFLKRLSLISLLFAVTSLSAVQAAKQVITPSTSTINSATANQAIEFKLIYTADVLGTSGVGITMYFDSSKLTFDTLTNTYGNGVAGIEEKSKEDKNNTDEDSKTDQLITAAWFSLTPNWPGATPIDLYTAKFTTAANFTGSTVIKFKGNPSGDSTLQLKDITVTSAAAVVAGDSGGEATPPPKKKKGGSLSWLFLLPLALLGLARKRIV